MVAGDLLAGDLAPAALDPLGLVALDLEAFARLAEDLAAEPRGARAFPGLAAADRVAFRREPRAGVPRGPRRVLSLSGIVTSSS